ncbi:hypothetical protein [Horticoccus sp. 23ND18S-11]|uniref:hypothetical protein n=1 Tax=Horticoccus sp. 23ND18S-11 TaxID=3391832 RepID=UPI0039C9F279
MGALVPVAWGAIWQSQDWALTGKLSGATGYDSNLTLARDGPGDMFVQARPELSFLRRNSGTEFHVDTAITASEFINGRQPGQTDLLFSATYGYPFAPDVFPLYRSIVAWQRTSEPDQYLGQRVQHDRASITGEGFVSLSGKLGLRGDVDAYVDEYEERTLNSNSRWRAFAGLAYEKRPGLQTSVNLGFARGRSRPNGRELGAAPVRSNEFYFTGKFRGEITPKITGNAYAGVGHVRYKGGYTNRYTLPVAGADLTWSVNPRRTVVLAAYSGADYAPDGQAVDTGRAFLSLTNVIVGSWQYTLRGGPTRTVFRREVKQSTDYSWEGGTEFAYAPSNRFRVGLGLMAGTHDSDVRERQYNRYVFTLDSSYRF